MREAGVGQPLDEGTERELQQTKPSLYFLQCLAEES